MSQARVWAVRISAALLAACAWSHVFAQGTLSESRLKAALVSKFPQFVEWPKDLIARRPSILICVAPPDPFGGDLPELVEGETLNGRPVVAKRVDREQDLDACQVLFLPARPGHHPHEFLQRAATLPILTVSDDPSFLDDGGIVRLRVVDGRVRFDVNDSAARRAGLRISSQLLQLALSVRGASR